MNQIIRRIMSIIGWIGLIGGFIGGIIILIIVNFTDMIVPVPFYLSFVGIVVMIMYGIYIWQAITKKQKK